MSNTGNVVVDGVVQIAVAALAKNQIQHEAVPDFLKKIGDQLVDCVKAAEAAAAGQTAPAQPAPVQEQRSQETASSAPQAPQQEEPKAAAPAAKTKRKLKVVEPTETAAKAAPAETVSEEAPEAKQEDGYKFAHISRTPVVPIDKSFNGDKIICLIDGEERKMLHRHLRSKYGMSEQEYREHFNLPDSYPMTSPSYSQEKSVYAKKQGLGTPRLYQSKKGATPAKVTKRRSSKKKVAEATSA